MNLNEKLENCMQESCIKQTQKRDVNSGAELKQIESQLNQHLRKKQGQKFKKVSVFQNCSSAYDENLFGSLVSEEIKSKFVGKKWNALPMSVKWCLAKEFLEEKKLLTDVNISCVRNHIQSNHFDRFKYDHSIHRLIDIDLS